MTQITDAIKAAMDELHMYLPDKPTEMLAYITEDVISRYEAALAVAPAVSPGRTSEPATDEEVDAEWEGFWKPIVAPTGEVDPDLVKLELYDFSQLIANAAEVYCHVTGGMISKVTTLPRQVIAVADDHMNKVYDEYAEEAVAPDHAPNDAAFEAAVGDWSDSLFDHGPGSARDSMTKYQRILALHRQAKHAGYVAGLTELRTIIQNRMDHFPQSDEAGEPNILWPGNELACMMLLDKIKSMLTEATNG